MRLVEAREERTRRSKALAVNPRTLEILEPTGVTARMLEIGRPLRGACFHRGEKVLADIPFAGIHPRFPFMLALSQATTERLLTEALEEAGGGIERGTKLVSCRLLDDGVEAELEPAEGGAREVVRCPWLLGADGAHSTVRHQLGIGFPGTGFKDDWHLADVPLSTDLPADRVHGFFLDGGAFLFLIPVVDDGPKVSGEEQLWRIVGNRPELLSRLVRAEPAGAAVWESSFHVSHRMAETLSKGSVYLAGDAAHIHSPAGARGMNLGIEDAWVFARLVGEGSLERYHHLRHSVDEAVVRRVEAISMVASAESRLLGLVRRFLFPLAVRIPFIRSRAVRTITGLDHALPAGLKGPGIPGGATRST